MGEVDTFKVDFLITAQSVTDGVETDNSELNVHVQYTLTDVEEQVETSNLSEVPTIVVEDEGATVGDGKMFGIDDVRPGSGLVDSVRIEGLFTGIDDGKSSKIGDTLRVALYLTSTSPRDNASMYFC